MGDFPIPTGNDSSSVSTLKIEKVPTDILGFDEIAHGGIPRGRTTLVSGTSGTGKTIFGMEFLVNGIVNHNEPGVFVTFEETPQDMIRNMMSFNWNIQKFIEDGTFVFVDASPSEDVSIEVGEFDLGGFLARLLSAIEKVHAKRMTIDSISALFPRYSDEAIIRRELYRIASKLKKLGITTILTAERLSEGKGRIGRFGVEEFVSDNVILLHNYIDEIRGDRKRSIEILKFRGSTHERQDTPLLVLDNGINVFPRPKPSFKGQKSSNVKISTGIPGLDQMFFGGVYSRSTTLVTGPSGTGKTVLSTGFIVEGAKRQERSLMISFEESTDQIFRNAESFGWELQNLINSGFVRIFSSVPEEHTAEEHFRRIRNIVEEVEIKRFVLDSLSALERIYPPDKFREFTVGLTAYLKYMGVTSFLTNTTSSLLDVSQITETNLSTTTDNIILLKYVELEGQMKRALAIIKARGSDHEKSLYEVLINNQGMLIGDAFMGVENLMSGIARRLETSGKNVIE